MFAIALLLAHGFFKAGLFLGAGSVMHGMNDEVNMRRYGGLARVMPITSVTFGLAYLAIIGIPPFSGFFAKDPIIEADFSEHGAAGKVLGTCALIGAGITAFYMTRMMFMTWYGKRRWEPEAHPHESPSVMTWPMIVLAIGSVGAGAFLILNDRLQNFLAPVVGVPPEPRKACSARRAWWRWRSPWSASPWPGSCTGGCRCPADRPGAAVPVTVAARKDLYGDAFNESVLMRPGQWLTRLSVFFDNRGVDGLVNTLAAAVGGTSGRVRKLQTGFVRSYALSMFFGAAVLVALLLVVRL